MLGRASSGNTVTAPAWTPRGYGLHKMPQKGAFGFGQVDRGAARLPAAHDRESNFKVPKEH